MKNFYGSNVLLIGHSNILMPLLAAFGAEAPFDTLDEDDYDLVYKLSLGDAGASALEIAYYGKLHHQAELPQKCKEDNRPDQQFTSPAIPY